MWNQVLITVILGTVFQATIQYSLPDADSFAFPDENIVYDNTITCPQNQSLYYQRITSEGQLSWFCDCKPGYIYHEATTSCYRAYTQGPCADQQYLILMKPSYESKCISNRCKKFNMVRYEGKCYELDTRKEDSNCIISIDTERLQPTCVRTTTTKTTLKTTTTKKRHDNQEKQFKFGFLKKPCPSGSTRLKNGECL